MFVLITLGKLVPPIAATISGVFPYLEAPGDESGNH